MFFFFVVVVLRSTGTLVITLKDFQLVFNFSLLVYGKRFRCIFVVMILHLYYNMRAIPTFPFVRKSPVSVQLSISPVAKYTKSKRSGQ